jgi:ribosome-associated protein
MNDTHDPTDDEPIEAPEALEQPTLDSADDAPIEGPDGAEQPEVAPAGDAPSDAPDAVEPSEGDAADDAPAEAVGHVEIRGTRKARRERRLEAERIAAAAIPKVENRYTRKARRDALDAEARILADRIISVRHEWFIQVPLDDERELHEAVVLARKLKRGGAKARQLRFVGRLLRDVDQAPLIAALDQAEIGHTLEKDVLHDAERWRDRIIDGGHEGIDAFLAEYPTVDRQHLHQLARQAAKDTAQGKPPKARRAIFRLIRPLLEG